MTIPSAAAVLALTSLAIVLATPAMYAFFDTTTIRIAAYSLRESLQHYRALHCDETPGTIHDSAAVLSDTNVFPATMNAIDPAINLFTWQYEVGPNQSATLVIIDDLSIRRRIQFVLGGQIQPPNRLAIPISRGRLVSLPNMVVNTTGETNANSTCF